MGTWAGYTRSVASETSTASIDLWKDSMAYLEMIGETEARRMDLKAGDYTHLNAAGGKVFGRLVSDLLSKNKVVGREARCVTTADAALNLKIVDGKPGF